MLCYGLNSVFILRSVRRTTVRKKYLHACAIVARCCYCAATMWMSYVRNLRQPTESFVSSERTPLLAQFTYFRAVLVYVTLITCVWAKRPEKAEYKVFRLWFSRNARSNPVTVHYIRYSQHHPFNLLSHARVFSIFSWLVTSKFKFLSTVTSFCFFSPFLNFFSYS